uniref:Uncharacterized protein n=1 Tax=Labrus bergylta TaxID=56723 RepID=A0A3Q3FU30_9LABR
LWGLFPWYGVTYLADHIDNITYTLQGFANETIKGFEYLSNTQKSHRLTLLKHDMALDYILAKQGGLCIALNLTGDACYTLIPDAADNMTSVIDALKLIRDSFGPSEGFLTIEAKVACNPVTSLQSQRQGEAEKPKLQK